MICNEESKTILISNGIMTSGQRKVILYGGVKMAIYAWTEGQRIYVRTPYEYKDIMKSITGGRWDKRNKGMALPTFLPHAC